MRWIKLSASYSHPYYSQLRKKSDVAWHSARKFEDAAIQPESMRLHVPPEVHPGHVARYALADWGSWTLTAQPPLFLAKGEPPLKPAAGIDKSSAYPAGGVG